MPTLTWGEPGDRTYQSGLDRGVLYLPDGSAVPWNGLISVVEKIDTDRDAVYFDGMKIRDTVVVGDYEATMRAVMYPPEFAELESMGHLRRGVIINDQPPQSFGLSYRTSVGDEVRGARAAYKLHLLYNLIAIPSDRNYSTRSADPSLVEFEWDLSAIPEEVPGFRPTAHLTFESDDLDPWLLEEIEAMLYGSAETYPELPLMTDLVEFIAEWARVKIVVNGDGTWTAVERRPGFIFPNVNDPGIFEIRHINAYFTDIEQETYILADTNEAMDLLDVRENADGTWVAISENDAVTQVVDGIFTLSDVEPVFTGPDMFRIKSKTSN